MAARVSSDSDALSLTAGVAMIGLTCLSGLLFFATYILSILQAYHYKGLAWAFVAGIPVVGQFIWFGFMWQTEGFINSYSLTSMAGLAFYVLATAALRYIERSDQRICSVSENEDLFSGTDSTAKAIARAGNPEKAPASLSASRGGL